MIAQTRDFGEIEVSERDIISFKQQIYGFDEYTDYVILYDESVGDDFAWLQSVQERDLCFLIAKPSAAVSEYKPQLPYDAVKQLGEGEYEYWLIMVVPEDIKESTVNLKSPIVLNPSQCSAVQVILEDNYPIRFRIFDEREGV